MLVYSHNKNSVANDSLTPTESKASSFVCLSSFIFQKLQRKDSIFLYLYFLTLPEGWNPFSISGVVQTTGRTRASISRSIEELVDLGYLEKIEGGYAFYPDKKEKN